MAEESDFAPYRPLAFDMREACCSGDECSLCPELRGLDFQVEKVFGTSPTVAEGERYVIRGRYTLAGEDTFAISIAVIAKAFGASAFVSPGEGRFEVSTEVLDLTGNRYNGLGIVVGNERAGKCELVRWVMLRE